MQTGATNRPDLLDPSLLRPGRFDRLVHLGADGDAAERRRILGSLTRRFRLGAGLTAGRLADGLLPAGLGEEACSRLTGADLAAVCSRAAMRAVAEAVQRMEERGIGECRSLIFVAGLTAGCLCSYSSSSRSKNGCTYLNYSIWL